MHKMELTCYAGSLECLKAALESGADSVYVGGESFGRDTLSDDFSREDLIEGIKFAHENNKKVYVTINLLPHNKDFKEFEAYLKTLDELNVDAVIVSEAGTLITVKQILPEMKIHLSNVSNVYNYETANFWHEQGVDRVVISRELSIKEMEKTEEICYQYVDLLKNVNKIFNMRVFSKEGINNLDDVIEKVENIIANIKNLFCGNIEELAKYDGQGIVDEYINQHYADAYDENLEYYIEHAIDIANEAFAELAEDAKDEADNLLEEIKNLGEISKTVLMLFKRLPLEKIKIDNTKK